MTMCKIVASAVEWHLAAVWQQLGGEGLERVRN
jgi:hypothetical protein